MNTKQLTNTIKYSVWLVILSLSIAITGCGKKASTYDSLIKEYKKCVSTGLDKNAALSDKTKALQRQLELNKEYETALKTLSQEEAAKLMAAWANAMAEASEGK
jgi:uncharacterized lipoprotein YehR (DUF1307 family)